MKSFIFILGVLLVSPGYAWAQQSPHMLQKWVHPGNDVIKESGYQGAQSCTVCHQNARDELINSVHWNFASPVSNIQGLPDSTWWGMANRECALAGSTDPANWTASTNGKATVQASGCGLCHIGSLASPPMPGKSFTEGEMNSVDCLVCHAKDYDWKKRATLVKDSTGIHWGQDWSMKAALSITKTPTNESCLRCHEHAFSNDYKRGTPYTSENDIHAKAGLRCVTCHETKHHKIAKGQYESDMVANDLPDVAVTCTKCHGDDPHRGENAEVLNEHTAKLACQTCHITQVSGIVREEWGAPVRDDIRGKYSALSRYDKIPSIPGIYVPTDTIAKGLPSYIWRAANNGKNNNAQSWMAFETADMKTEGAKIFPVRGLIQGMLFDKKLKMWQAPGMAFLRDNPQMAEFPLLLAPNREVYNTTGNVKAAIDAGMKPYEAMGLKWSGEWMSMQVPGVSYISVNHGIKKVGLSCNSCHSNHGAMDFKALGYSAQQVKHLEKLQ